ncbi:MAG: hypothetical protein ACLQVN_05375 [Bryobacteraceae bacterium]
MDGPEEMDWLEEELRKALAREVPARDFAVPRRRPAWRGWATAAAAVLVLSAGAGYRQYQGREAKRQLKLALEIAGAKTSRIQAQLREFSR